MMTWGQIKNLFAKGAGGSNDAYDEAWEHINSAYREICGSLELAELHVPDAKVNAKPGVDFIPADEHLYSVDWIVNTKTGRKLDQEPGGMRGRARFIEDGASRPPLGEPSFWVRKGDRIWLRDTPDEELELLISYRQHPPYACDDNLTEHPILPNTFDMTIVRLALASYFTIHPPRLADGAVDYQRSATLRAAGLEDVTRAKSPVAEEHLDSRRWVRQLGYDFNLSGR